MGLGKTLQTLCVLASSHHDRMESVGACKPSLVVCPPTLCQHWKMEIDKFLGGDSSLLDPFVYGGSAQGRAGFNKSLCVFK